MSEPWTEEWVDEWFEYSVGDRVYHIRWNQHGTVVDSISPVSLDEITVQFDDKDVVSIVKLKNLAHRYSD